jgi:hypothetical protein
MTSQYIISKIEKKAITLNNTNCLLIYCLKTFNSYLTDKEIIETINNVNKKKEIKKYKTYFKLSN